MLLFTMLPSGALSSLLSDLFSIIWLLSVKTMIKICQYLPVHQKPDWQACLQCPFLTLIHLNLYPSSSVIFSPRYTFCPVLVLWLYPCCFPNGWVLISFLPCNRNFTNPSVHFISHILCKSPLTIQNENIAFLCFSVVDHLAFCIICIICLKALIVLYIHVRIFPIFPTN